MDSLRERTGSSPRERADPAGDAAFSRHHRTPYQPWLSTHL